jgi:hypothetical protein
MYMQSRLYACNFLSVMKILKHHRPAEIHVGLFSTAQMTGFFFKD